MKGARIANTTKQLRRETAMNRTRVVLLLAVLIFPVLGVRAGTMSAAVGARPVAASRPELHAQQTAPTVASVLDGEISAVEKEIVGAAEAMPEEKYNFSPESLKIPGSEYKGAHVCRAGEARGDCQLFHLGADYRRAGAGKFEGR
jgi:hypothetical protein